MAVWRHRAPDVIVPGKTCHARRGICQLRAGFHQGSLLQREHITERSWKHMNCLLWCCSAFTADAAHWHCVDLLTADSISNTHHKHLQ